MECGMRRLSFGLSIACTCTVLWAGAAAAQMGFGSGGDSDVTTRYNKARKGANIDEWVRRLTDESPETRLEAVKSLGDSGDPKAVEPLMQAVGDLDPRIQAKAVDYLGTTRATDATFFLVQRLFLADTPDPLRHRILNALGKIGDFSASRPILDYVAREAPLDLRGTGIFALGEIADPASRTDLVAMLDSEQDSRLRRLIQEAVTKIDTRQAAPAKNEGPFPSPLEAALATDPER